MNKIFFDTNILLDILIPSRANHQKALIAYESICQKFDILATSENILTTIEYIASKNKTDCKVISDFFMALTSNFEIYSFSEVLEESLLLYKDACFKNTKIDFEDLLQLQTAIKHNCNYFITEDRGILENKKIKILCLDDYASL